MKYLITGLGNIGAEYAGTRHNIGFRVVNKLVDEAGVRFTEERYGAIARLRVKNCELVVLKPNTFMNLSGNAVRYWLQKENIAVENLLVVVDDLALPFGTLRLKPQGSDAGHNGLKNIAQIERSKHRSFINLIANSLSAIAPYCIFEKKPAIEVNFINDGNLISFDFMLNSSYLLFQIVFKIGKLNSTYVGLKGRKTRVERKILRFPPTRLS